MQKNNIIKHAQSGLSLIEVMIALALGLLLIIGAGQIYLGSKMSYRVNEGLAHIQEAGRFASETLARNIRMAGFQGCMGLDRLKPNILATGISAAAAFHNDGIVTGVNNVASGTKAGSIAVRPGTDMLTVRYASPVAAKLSSDLVSADAALVLTANPAEIKVDDAVFITDCVNADLFRVTGDASGATNPLILRHDDSGNTSSSLSKAYRRDALVMPLESKTYFIGETGDTNQQGQPIYALYERSLKAGVEMSEQLLEGVENMQIQFGRDQNGDGEVDDYVTAAALSSSNFDRIIAVRVALLLSSVEAVLDHADTATYTLLDETIDPADTRQLRRSVTFTTSIRNRELRSASFGS